MQLFGAMIRNLTSLLFLLLVAGTIWGSECTTNQNSSGNKTFCNPDIWTCIPSGTTHLNASTLIIDHKIEIQNSCVVAAAFIYIKDGASLEFKGNGKLILTDPNAQIIIEDGGLLFTTNNSTQTLVEIGGVGVWGGAIGNNDSINGPSTLGGPGVFLPLSWVDVRVEYSSSLATIAWSTAAEENCSHFVVMRSRDGNTWDALGEVAAVNRYEAENSYNFTDKHPLPGESFYQVLQYDFNGAHSKSPIVSLISPVADVRFFPNPTSGSISASFDRSWVGGTVTVFDHTGRILEVYLISIQNQAINLSSLPVGLYMLRLENQGMQLTYPLVRQ